MVDSLSFVGQLYFGHHKAVVLLGLIRCVLLLPLLVRLCVWFLFCYTVLSVRSSVAIQRGGRNTLIVLLLPCVSSDC